jgi:acyl-CoA reductase-like NAD-dependent aldehyde dehydrogenase
MDDGEKVITTRYTPLGVIGAICPWNFPILLAIGKIIPAVLTVSSSDLFAFDKNANM